MMFFSTFSQTESVRSSAYFGEPVKHVITLRGDMLVSCGVVVGGRCCVRCRGAVAAIQNARVSVQNVRVCPSKTSPCMPAPRGAGTHGKVLNEHTESFLNPHTGGFAAFHTTTQDNNHNSTRRHGKKTEKEDTERERR